MGNGPPREITDTTPQALSHPLKHSGISQVPASDELTWPLATIHSVADAILHTLVYADLFDFPLTCEEIHRYLPRYRAPLKVIEDHIANHDQLRRRLEAIPPFWFLAGRGHLVAVRQEREAFAQSLWPLARRYAQLIATAPFVRMVAITGSLAMNNVSSDQDDVDFLIVAQPGRVWLARGLVVLVVHLARRAGVELCPNYVIAEHHLQLGEPSLFTAHELAQLMPLYGWHTYQHLLQSNAWMARYLPNAPPRQSEVCEISPAARRVKGLMEGLLGGRTGDALERWERERKIPRLRQEAAERGGTGAQYTPDLCKGHVDDHATDVHQRYAARLAAQDM